MAICPTIFSKEKKKKRKTQSIKNQSQEKKKKNKQTNKQTNLTINEFYEVQQTRNLLILHYPSNQSSLEDLEIH
jgi:hypothetical protein